MPYSKKHNVLFIHIPKCAGKSFETAMGMASKEENTRYVWRNFVNKAAKLILKISADKMALKRLWGVHDYGLVLQHLTYQEIVLLSLMENEVLEKSMKVAIVRNPYDRAISSYHHMKKGNQTFLSFVEEFYFTRGIRHNDFAHRRTQVDFLRNINGEIAIDHLLRFETLNDDYNDFILKNKIKAIPLPHLGNQKNKIKKKKDFYCKASRRIVNEYFKEDFNKLGYKVIL